MDVIKYHLCLYPKFLPILSQVELSTFYNTNISTMITSESSAVLRENQTEKKCNESLCIFEQDCWTKQFRLSGLVLIFIALIFALIILLKKNLHSPSSKNAIFMIITAIIMTIGVVLLNPPGDWYEHVIADIVPTVLTILAMLIGIKMKVSAQKWVILLFTFCCLLLAAGIALSFLA
ncbi:unnamed protein product, partial [Schistosoma turkestanicum]